MGIASPTWLSHRVCSASPAGPYKLVCDDDDANNLRGMKAPADATVLEDDTGWSVPHHEEGTEEPKVWVVGDDEYDDPSY